ncbi:hypothetical protein PAHAL_8G224700 [Panicum hallii]|uniref:Uncharacterized protein n=1 Tax=Panicum hallii TaxID=206008 RepID=A0A2T8I9W4_9POAL|nr:hypothetical protein PAHAL_8G224700 [Panicum hallii]
MTFPHRSLLKMPPSRPLTMMQDLHLELARQPCPSSSCSCLLASRPWSPPNPGRSAAAARTRPTARTNPTLSSYPSSQAPTPAVCSTKPSRATSPTRSTASRSAAATWTLMPAAPVSAPRSWARGSGARSARTRPSSTTSASSASPTRNTSLTWTPLAVSTPPCLIMARSS